MSMEGGGRRGTAGGEVKVRRMEEEESCQGVMEGIKAGGVKTFSFIAGEGARQLARLSSVGLYSSFNGSVSDSQHKSQLAKTPECVFGVRADARACGRPAWCHQPASPESR